MADESASMQAGQQESLSEERLSRLGGGPGDPVEASGPGERKVVNSVGAGRGDAYCTMNGVAISSTSAGVSDGLTASGNGLPALSSAR
jgi:hypothetical protein